jgi:hypothetical protein
MSTLLFLAFLGLSKKAVGIILLTPWAPFILLFVWIHKWKMRREKNFMAAIYLAEPLHQNGICAFAKQEGLVDGTGKLLPPPHPKKSHLTAYNLGRVYGCLLNKVYVFDLPPQEKETYLFRRTEDEAVKWVTVIVNTIADWPSEEKSLFLKGADKYELKNPEGTSTMRVSLAAKTLIDESPVDLFAHKQIND